jgi:hypothetical protein
MTDRARLLARLAPLVVAVVLAVAWLAPALPWVRFATPAADASARMTAALDALPGDPLVLVAFDPDIGTYAEVRPTARAVLADLLAREARLAFVSLTAEGRALAVAEQARLIRHEANASRLVDLGFVPGAEAGLVDLTRGLPPAADDTPALARQLSAEGMAALDAVAVVGGNDLGPRSWVEQVAPRVGDLPILAITPTVLLPEVQPYVEGGQLTAALSTPRDGAAYREALQLGNLDRLAEPTGPRELPILVGMLIAITALGQALGARLIAAVRAGRQREAR